MQRLRSLSTRLPLTFSIIITVVFWGAMTLASFLITAFLTPLFYGGEYAVQAAAELFVLLPGLGMTALFGLWGIWRERRRSFARGLLSGGYFIFIAIYSLMSSLLLLISGGGSYSFRPAWQLPIFIAAMFLIGLTEELYFRGLVSNLFLERFGRNSCGVWSAVICSGMIFGLMHLGNLFVAAPGGVLIQTFAAIAMGMAFTAIYYRTRNIWVVIFLHAFNDFCALMTSACISGVSVSGVIGSYSPLQFISAAPYIIVTVVLLRDNEMDRICRFSSPEEKYMSERASRPAFAVVLTLGLVIAAAIVAAYFIV